PYAAQRNLVLGARAPTIVFFLTHPPEKKPPSSGEGHNLAPVPRFLELSSMVPGCDQEASRNPLPTVAPRSCGIKSVLPLLQGGLVRHLSASTSRSVFSHHDLVKGRSVGHDLLRGVRKTASPIALTSVKSGKPPSPLQQLLCLEFGPVNSHVALGTRPEYVPMVTTTPFRDQVVTLQAIPYQEDDPNLTLLCPVRVPRIYLERSQTLQTFQSALCLLWSTAEGEGCLQTRISHWLVDTIRTAYRPEACPATGNENPVDQGHRCPGSSCKWGLVNRHLQSCRLGYTYTLANLRMEPVSARVLNASSWLSILVGCRACLSTSPNGDYASKFGRFPDVNPGHLLHHLALLHVAEFGRGTRCKNPTQ
ncbi:hypothetical protein M9458_051051, partial [Cirrhinus mrigala]